MPNNIELAKIYQAELDKALVAQAVTGFMELNSDQIKYQGGNEIKIPKMSMDGLGDYNRSTGFVDGAVTLSFETKTMTQDRGRSFSLDAMDIDETNFAATAASVLGEFQKTQVVPEVDSYRISKLATLAIAGGKAEGGYTPVAATILAELKNDIAAIQDVVGDEVELVVLMAKPAMTVLEAADGLTRFLSADIMKKGDIETRVKSLDGTPILGVPSARMKTAYVFNDGKTAGQEAGGYAAAVGAKNVNWIIVPKNAPIAVSKTDKIRIFSPDENQNADAFKLDVRKYHDLFVLDNAIEGMRVNVKEVL